MYYSVSSIQHVDRQEERGIRGKMNSGADKVSSVAAASFQEEEEEEELECENCNERYYESKNDDNNACMWYSTTHKGMYLCDYESEFWYGWHEANNPKKSSYWKEQRDGGQK
jgi:hypothetical protein